MRRVIIIAGIVILLLILGIGLYFLFFASKPAAGGTPGTTGTLPATGNQTGSTASSTITGTATTIGQNFGVVANGPVLDYFVSKSNVITVINADGTVTQVANGQVSTLSSSTLQNILSASFSYDGAKILISFGTIANPQASIFDIASRTWTAFNSGMQSPAWSPSDYRIAFATTNQANGMESFSIIDASKAKPTPTLVETLYAQNMAVGWPTKNQLAFYTKASAYAAGSAFTFQLQQKTLTSIASEVYGLGITWNPYASTSSSPASLLFSSTESGLGGFLQLVGPGGSNAQVLKFVSLPSKCAFGIGVSTTSASATATSTPIASPTYLFCGVPSNQEQLSLAHLPDDYDQMTLFTTDNLYRINTTDGTIDTVLNTSSGNVDITDIKSFNNAVYFVNRYDQKLYSVSLPQN